MPTKILWGFELYDDAAQRWDRDMVGPQDASNLFASKADAEAELPSLAGVLGVEPEKLRVVMFTQGGPHGVAR